MSRDIELVYVGDPMCSWCWGFAPVLEGLELRFDLPLRIVMGGLAPGGAARPLDDKLAEVIGHHWHQVEEASGQPFDHEALSRPEGWRYDTELPCTAVVAARSLDEDLARPMLERVHRAFYAEGVDVTDPAAYPELAAGLVPDLEAYLEALGSEDVREATWQDFAWSRRMGVTGYPTLLLRDGEQWHAVSRGYQPLDSIQVLLRRWLDKRLEPTELGRVCRLDGAGC